MHTKKTVLIVDDDELVLESIDLLLSNGEDFQTIRARGSEGAVSHMTQAACVDVIVADVILSGELSGIDICRRAMAQCPDIAIVIITADTEVHRTDTPPHSVLLRKPFGGDQLIAAIENALTQVSAKRVK